MWIYARINTTMTGQFKICRHSFKNNSLAQLADVCVDVAAKLSITVDSLSDLTISFRISEFNTRYVCSIYSHAVFLFSDTQNTWNDFKKWMVSPIPSLLFSFDSSASQPPLPFCTPFSLCLSFSLSHLHIASVFVLACSSHSLCLAFYPRPWISNSKIEFKKSIW